MSRWDFQTPEKAFPKDILTTYLEDIGRLLVYYTTLHWSDHKNCPVWEFPSTNPYSCNCDCIGYIYMNVCAMCVCFFCGFKCSYLNHPGILRRWIWTVHKGKTISKLKFGTLHLFGCILKAVNLAYHHIKFPFLFFKRKHMCKSKSLNNLQFTSIYNLCANPTSYTNCVSILFCWLTGCGIIIWGVSVTEGRRLGTNRRTASSGWTVPTVERLGIWRCWKNRERMGETHTVVDPSCLFGLYILYVSVSICFSFEYWRYCRIS